MGWWSWECCCCFCRWQFRDHNWSRSRHVAAHSDNSGNANLHDGNINAGALLNLSIIIDEIHLAIEIPIPPDDQILVLATEDGRILTTESGELLEVER